MELKTVYVPDQGPKSMFVVQCQHCDEEFSVPRASVKAARTEKLGAPSKIDVRHAERGLKDAGWSFKPGPRRTICPKCQEVPEPIQAREPTPEAKTTNPPKETEDMSAKIVELADAPLPSKPLIPLPTKDAPAQPTREQLRRISEHLDSDYDTSRGVYLRDGSDAKIAKLLDMPRKWVVDLRVMLYGADDRNEMQEMSARVTAEFENRIKKVEENFYAAFEEAEKELTKIRSDLKALMKR